MKHYARTHANRTTDFCVQSQIINSTSTIWFGAGICRCVDISSESIDRQTSAFSFSSSFSYSRAMIYDAVSVEDSLSFAALVRFEQISFSFAFLTPNASSQSVRCNFIAFVTSSQSNQWRKQLKKNATTEKRERKSIDFQLKFLLGFYLNKFRMTNDDVETPEQSAERRTEKINEK